MGAMFRQIRIRTQNPTPPYGYSQKRVDIVTVIPRPIVKWLERPAADHVVDDVARMADVPRALARVLVGRGVDSSDAARAYLAPKLGALPDPARLAGMDEALERVVFAIEKGETIG